MDFQQISSSCLKEAIILNNPCSLKSFNENIASKKMQDVYYTEARLSDTGSVIIVAIDQLRDTPASLLSLLLQIVNVAVR